MIKKILLIAFIFVGANILAQTPVLNNFRIENSQKNRIYFDSSAPIAGTSITGFEIGDNKDKQITSVTINTGSLTGHYFTVDSGFSFWDNNTIHYKGGSNIGIYPFGLQYIDNNIDEPVSTIFRYASVTGGGTHDGTSEENAWTLAEAQSGATGGMTIWLKAGAYGAQRLTVSNKATSATTPIKFIGYKTTTGDITSMYYNYVLPTGGKVGSHTLTASEMPYLKDNGTVGALVNIQNDFLIFRNIQTEYGIANFKENGGRDGIIIDNCIALDARGTNSGISTQYGSSRVRVINSLVINSEMANIFLGGQHGLIENTENYSDDASGSDYYIFIGGSNNIVRNCYSERGYPDGHGGHGIGIKTQGLVSSVHWATHNLFENNDVVGTLLALELRHSKVQYNVIRNHRFTNGIINDVIANYPSQFPAGFNKNAGGFVIRDNASFNVIEDSYTENVRVILNFRDSPEEGTQPSATSNIIRNNVFNGARLGIVASNVSSDSRVIDNVFINNVFYNVDEMYSGGGGLLFEGDNKMINCIFMNNTARRAGSTETYYGFSGPHETYCSYFGNGYASPTTTGTVDGLDPLFINAATGNFRLQENSPIKDAGVNSTLLNYDKDGIERFNGKYSIGAYEDTAPRVGSVSPNSHSLCVGENVTLVASGGTSYSWNTGETSESITVSPATTTTYTVTISDGTNSDSHDVLVTVDTIPTVNAGSDQTICEGEDITLTAEGEGNFLWSTGETTASISVNPSTTTTYSVTASNSCSTDATDEVIVTVTPEVTLDAGSDVSICSGDNVTLTATGTGPFDWSTGETTASITVNPTSTTIYSITSTNGNCSLTDEVTVTVNTTPTVNVGQDQTICEGESVTLTATGGGNLLWSTGETTASITVNPSTTTTYSVIASNSCSSDATDEIIVNVTDIPNIDAGSDVDIVNGENVTLTATGNGNFLWSTGETTSSITVSPSATTTYVVTVTSIEGCSNQDEVVVNVTNNSETAVTANAGPDVEICQDESTILTASGGENYIWNTGETTASITVAPTETSTYSVTVSNENSIDTDQVMVTVDQSCSGLGSRIINNEIKLYPNPTEGLLNIELEGYSDELIIALYNLSGALVYTENVNNYSPDKILKLQLDLSRYGRGVYFVRIINNNISETKKILVI